jgi:hypothetical protein
VSVAVCGFTKDNNYIHKAIDSVAAAEFLPAVRNSQVL